MAKDEGGVADEGFLAFEALREIVEEFALGGPEGGGGGIGMEGELVEAAHEGGAEAVRDGPEGDHDFGGAGLAEGAAEAEEVLALEDGALAGIAAREGDEAGVGEREVGDFAWVEDAVGRIVGGEVEGLVGVGPEDEAAGVELLRFGIEVGGIRWG